MVDLIIGHLIGDYILQNDWMAVQKKKHEGMGWLTCTVHCLLYTAAVCATTWCFNLQWVALVFLSHFLIDKTSFVEKYSEFIGSRSIQKFLTDEENANYSPHIGLRSGLTILVYVARDNALHLSIMYFGWRILYG